MRRLSSRSRTRGFTLVELLVTIGVFALLAAMAVPTMRSVIENSHMRAAGQSLQNGLAMARAEAVRLNTQVEFVLTATGWSVNRVDGVGGGLLHQASGKERATGVTITPTPADSTRISFDAFGRRLAVNPSDASATITQIDIVATNPSGSPGYKPLRVQVTSGGLARLCEPAVASTEPKACL
jgi:type IV fimbrial biogenesis protein FimT